MKLWTHHRNSLPEPRVLCALAMAASPELPGDEPAMLLDGLYEFVPGRGFCHAVTGSPVRFSDVWWARESDLLAELQPQVAA